MRRCAGSGSSTASESRVQVGRSVSPCKAVPEHPRDRLQQRESENISLDAAGYAHASAASSASALGPSPSPSPAAAPAPAPAAFLLFFFLFFFFFSPPSPAAVPPSAAAVEPATGPASLPGRVQPGAAVRTSTPVSVMRSVSSNWAEALPSIVTAVHCERERAREGGSGGRGEEREREKSGTHVVRPVDLFLLPDADHRLDRERLRGGGRHGQEGPVRGDERERERERERDAPGPASSCPSRGCLRSAARERGVSEEERASREGTNEAHRDVGHAVEEPAGRGQSVVSSFIEEQRTTSSSPVRRNTERERDALVDAVPAVRLVAEEASRLGDLLDPSADVLVPRPGLAHADRLVEALARAGDDVEVDLRDRRADRVCEEEEEEEEGAESARGAGGRVKAQK